MTAPKFVLRGNLADEVDNSLESMAATDEGDPARVNGRAALDAATYKKSGYTYTLSSEEVVLALDSALDFIASPWGNDDTPPATKRAAAKKLTELRAINPYKDSPSTPSTENPLADSSILLIGAGIVLLGALGYWAVKQQQSPNPLVSVAAG